MVQRQDMLGLLLSSCPSFVPSWTAGEERYYLDAGGSFLYYVALGDFARHLVQLALAGKVEEFPTVFEVVERLHVEGDHYVREAATIGLLEGIQNNASHTSLDQSFFEPYLGPESRKWWDRLNDFWAGKTPFV